MQAPEKIFEGDFMKLTAFCFTDIHNQSAMLDSPTTLRSSLRTAVREATAEFGLADLAVVGGDNVSDYPYWNRSCALPKKNFLDIKKKLCDCVASSAKGGRALYVAGNNDMILGDIGCTENPPYNTTEFYYTGPMKDTLGTLADGECYTVRAEQKPEEFPYLDAFHYVVGGVDFIGINIDPNTAYNSHEGYYTEETLDWVDAKLREIDPDGNKPIFVVGHLSALYCRDGVWEETMINGSAAHFYRALSGHRNLFYLYGHVHGAGYVYQGYSSGAVVHLTADGKPLGDNLAANDSAGLPPYGMTLVHMGGLRPFFSPTVAYFADDGLTGFGGEEKEQYFPCTATPRLAQYLVMEVHDDRVVFSIRNAGCMEGYDISDKPLPYTVYFQK